MDEYDAVIIGCGPAGLSAAIFCGRAQLKTLVIGLPEKSQAKLAMHIENYFGFPEGIDGPILLNKGIIQAQKFGVKFVKEEAVAATRMDDKKFVIKTNKGQDFSCRGMIIATGVPIRLSGIKNEDVLTGKGVHYCVSCDGAFYKDKKVAVIGNSDHAAEASVEALSYTHDITIVSNDKTFNFSDVYDKQLTKWNIKTMIAKVREFKGEKWLDTLVLDDGKEVKFDGIFMACGTAGALDFAANLGLEIKNNVLVVDENSMTSMEGVFAAGNCSDKCRQIAKNVGDGCNAAVSAIKYLRSRELYLDYVHNMGDTSSGNAQNLEEKKPGAEEKNPKIEETASSTIIYNAAQKRKLRVGWFSFSCCEDSTILFTELLNDYYDKMKDVVDITYLRALRSKNDMTNLDLAFVEGAISNEKAENELKEIRKNAKKLIAVGACAVTGMPSGQRNNFDERRNREIEPIIRTFDLSKTVKPVHEIVTVDDNVPGCPMLESIFLSVFNKYLKEFGFDAQL